MSLRLSTTARLRPIPPEEPPIDLNALVEANVGAYVAALGAAVVLLFLIVLLQRRQVRRLRRRLEGLTRGERGRSLEAILDAHVDKVYAVARELDELSARSAVLEANGRRAFQRVGLVRFNPFEDTGGNQSFALAMLDAQGDGFVVSSLHARTGTRVYAKALSAGQSDGALSTEEAEALRRALDTAPSNGQGLVARARRGS